MCTHHNYIKAYLRKIIASARAMSANKFAKVFISDQWHLWHQHVQSARSLLAYQISHFRISAICAVLKQACHPTKLCEQNSTGFRVENDHPENFPRCNTSTSLDRTQPAELSLFPCGTFSFNISLRYLVFFPHFSRSM